jgi:hypothetical protein
MILLISTSQVAGITSMSHLTSSELSVLRGTAHLLAPLGNVPWLPFLSSEFLILKTFFYYLYLNTYYTFHSIFRYVHMSFYFIRLNYSLKNSFVLFFCLYKTKDSTFNLAHAL